jgi:hypothetical protein
MAENTQTPEQNADVVAQLAELKAGFAAQNETIAKQQQLIDALQKKETVIETKAKKMPEIPKKLVEHKGKKYKWNVPHFRHGSDEVITSEDAATDPEMIGKILKVAGQGILTEQV